MEVWAIVLAGGSGSRFGAAAPKQYEPLHGRRVIDWSLDAARSVAGGIVLVVAPDYVDQPEPAADVIVVGGASRAASVRAGLAVVPRDVQVIVVHDAARPLASPTLFRAVVDAVEHKVDGAIPGVAVTDTIKRVAGAAVVGTVDRTDLVAVQTPQAFRAGVLRLAHRPGGDATDDAALVEQMGGCIVVVPGEPHNIKITHPDDLAVAALHLG